MTNKWDYRFLELAEHVAQWSKDTTKVGAVIVGPDREVRSLGYNGFPRGVRDNIRERDERPLKYFWTAHAELNAILNATRAGIPIKDCALYLQWFPCTECAKAIIQAGLSLVVCPAILFKDQSEKWKQEFEISREMFQESNVDILFLKPQKS